MLTSIMDNHHSPKQNIINALRGDPVQKIPIWLREGFPIGEPFPPVDDFTMGWQNQKLYKELYRDISPHVCAIRPWGFDEPWINRFLMIPPNKISIDEQQLGTDIKRITGTVNTPRGELFYVNEIKRGTNTVWHVEPLVKSIEELKMLAEVPFEYKSSDIDLSLKPYYLAHEEVNEKGVLTIWLSSPIVSFSGCMGFSNFLELTITHNSYVHKLLEEVTRRNLILIDAIFANRAIDTTVTFGGSEQCTPPMMSPKSFDEFVMEYDGLMLEKLKGYGILGNCHCHGRVKYALHRMVEMGFDATDPIEPLPAGDLSYAEAREISDDKITLIGNLEFEDLCYLNSEDIRDQVKKILSYGSKRLILGASAGPISEITPKIAENYRTWIETALEFG